MDQWVEEFKLDGPSSRALYLTCAELLRAGSKKKRSGTREAMNLVLKCFDGMQGPGVTPQELASVVDAAAQAVGDFVRSPDMFQFDMWDAPAVKQLGGVKAHADLYTLLVTLITGDLPAFEAFAKVLRAAGGG